MKPVLNIIISTEINPNESENIKKYFNEAEELIRDYHVIVTTDNTNIVAHNMIQIKIDDISQLDFIEKTVELLRTFPSTVIEDLNSGYEDIDNIPLNPSDEYIIQMMNDINLTPNEIDDEYILELIALMKDRNIDPMLITEMKFDINQRVPWKLLDDYTIKLCNGDREKILIEAAMRRNITRDLKNHKGRRIW